MNKLHKLGLIFLSVLTILGISFFALYPQMSVSASADYLSVSLSEGKYYDYNYTVPTVTQTSTRNWRITNAGAGTSISIGSGTSTFANKMLFSAFDGECTFAITCPLGSMSTSSFTGSGESAVITVQNTNYALIYKPVGVKQGFNDLGGFDFSITLKKKLATPPSSFSFTISNKVGVTPYLQPELTAEEIAEGCVRPDYVVNSIAFYADGKSGNYLAMGGKNYRTGKVGHLYRLKATDSLGNWAWLDWGLPNSTTVTLTDTTGFLKIATYPVVIAPVGDTFGYSGAAATSSAVADKIYTTWTTYTPVAGTTTSISVCADSASTYEIKAGIYNGTDLVNGSQVAIPTTNSSGWFTGNVSVAVTATGYYLAAKVNNTACDLRYDDTDLDYYYCNDAYANNLPDPITWTSTTTDRTYGIYCTYTPTASLDIANTPSSKAFGIVANSTTYWAIGHTPDNPIDDGHCTFTLTNNAASACDIDAKMADFSGGVGWNIGAPAENQARVTWFKSGDDPSAGTVLTNSDQEVYDALAASGHFHWEFKLETPTSVTDGVQKSGVLTLTAVAED